MLYAYVKTDWGLFLYGASEVGLRFCRLPDEPDAHPHATAQRYWPGIRHQPVLLPDFEEEIQRYFSGESVWFHTALDLSDYTPFQQNALLACHSIPPGETWTYSELAYRSGHSGAARAVGTVMAGNPMPIVIPCHRVVRVNGQLGGFSSPSGVTMKRRLLNHEKAFSRLPQTSLCLVRE